MLRVILLFDSGLNGFRFEAPPRTQRNSRSTLLSDLAACDARLIYFSYALFPTFAFFTVVAIAVSALDSELIFLRKLIGH